MDRIRCLLAWYIDMDLFITPDYHRIENLIMYFKGKLPVSVAVRLTIVAVLVIAVAAFIDQASFGSEIKHSLFAFSRLVESKGNGSLPESAAYLVPAGTGKPGRVVYAQPSCFVTITSPVEGEQVNQDLAVEGEATQGCTEGGSLYVVVASADRMTLWPQVGRLVLLPTNGSDNLQWFTSASVGEADDSGEQFSILVIFVASGSPAEQAIEESIETGREVSNDDIFAGEDSYILDVVSLTRQ